MFQLLTVGPLPREWSPTGPFSTALPLLFCILLEIITDIYVWINNWLIDYRDNNKLIDCYDGHLQLSKVKSMHLRPGNVVKLYRDDIVPVDGILLDHSGSRYGKISLAALNGESNIHYVERPTDLPKFPDLNSAHLAIDDYMPTNFYEIKGKVTLDSKTVDLDGSSFVVSNSIVKSDELTLWCVKCGNDRKSYSKVKQNENTRKSRLDAHIANYMISYNTYILMFFILVMSSIKLTFSGSWNPFMFLFYGVQNWILFNGIIPFSAKILLILSKKLEALMLNMRSHIRVINSVVIDDVPKIDKIITDKTGTLTRNELEFCKILQKGDVEVHDVEQIADVEVNGDFLKCLGLCIHQADGNFSTIEDKTIRCRYEYLNSKVVQEGNSIILTLKDEEYRYRYVEVAGLDFTYDRKLSSKIVHDNQNGKYYIYTKGSIEAIRHKLVDEDVPEMDRLEGNISMEHPELRLLGCAFREVHEEELQQKQHKLADSLHTSMFVSELENDLCVLGIIGIRDNLQDGVSTTIGNLADLGIHTCMCTGDRKITALAIAREAGIITDANIIDYDIDGMNKDTKNGTIAISGPMLQEILHDNGKLEVFRGQIKNCKNFVAYNLIPTHKSALTDILEANKIRTLCIGDGFNDVNMFQRSSISVSIQGNDYVESNSDFSIKEFKHLWDLVAKVGTSYYNKNTIIGNYSFYRSVAVITSLVVYNLINYNKPTVSILNGFVIQGFNFLWCLMPLVYESLRLNFDKQKNGLNRAFQIAKRAEYSNDYNTTLWNLNGLITGLLVTVYMFWHFGHMKHFSDILGLLLVFTVNFKFLHYGYNSVMDILAIMLGPSLFLLYTLFSGSFIPILKLFSSLYNVEVISLLAVMLLAINFFIK